MVYVNPVKVGWAKGRVDPKVSREGEGRSASAKCMEV